MLLKRRASRSAAWRNRVLALLASAVLAVQAIAVLAVAPAEATTISLTAFVQQTQGKQAAYTNGTLKGECTSLITQYLTKVYGLSGVPQPMAYDYANVNSTVGKFLQNAKFAFHTGSGYTNGDILVWTGGSGHVGIWYSGSGISPAWRGAAIYDQNDYWHTHETGGDPHPARPADGSSSTYDGNAWPTYVAPAGLDKSLKFAGYWHRAVATLPTQPGSPTAKSATATSVKLTWKDASNNETSFATQYSSNGGKTWQAGSSAGANATSITLGGLKPKTAYTFQIGARNSAGTHWSAYAKATTPAQPAVSGKPVVRTQLEPKPQISGVTPIAWVPANTNLTLQCLTTGEKAYGALASADPYYYRVAYSGKTGYVSDSDVLTAKNAPQLGLGSC